MVTRKPGSLAGALALLVVALPACDRLPWQQEGPAGPSVIVQTSQTVTIGATPAPSPSPTPAQAGFCPTPSAPVASLRFGVRQGTCSQEAARGCAVLALRSGEVAVLDISPLDAQGNLVACHGTLSISAGPAAQVTLTGGGGTDFLPSLRGGSPGSGRVDAEVNGTSGVLLVDVRP